VPLEQNIPPAAPERHLPPHLPFRAAPRNAEVAWPPGQAATPVTPLVPLLVERAGGVLLRFVRGHGGAVGQGGGRE